MTIVLFLCLSYIKIRYEGARMNIIIIGITETLIIFSILLKTVFNLFVFTPTFLTTLWTFKKLVVY